MGKASLELYRVFEMSLSPANMANSWGPGSRNTQYYISQRAESTLTYLPPMSNLSLFATYRLSPPTLSTPSTPLLAQWWLQDEEKTYVLK